MNELADVITAGGPLALVALTVVVLGLRVLALEGRVRAAETRQEKRGDNHSARIQEIEHWITARNERARVFQELGGREPVTTPGWRLDPKRLAELRAASEGGEDK